MLVTVEGDFVSLDNVICDCGGNTRVEKGIMVKLDAGMILSNTVELIGDSHFMLATMVGQIISDKIKEYV